MTRETRIRPTATCSEGRLLAIGARQLEARPDDVVTRWAVDVLEGRIVQGPHVRNTCRRHLLDLQEGAQRGLTFDVDLALHKIGFFPTVLRLNGGQFEGIPFELHPSQAFRVGSIFGWLQADGTRRFRRFYDEEGKGNGKSPLAAGIGMLGLVADGEARAEVYAAASKKDQAMVLFRDAVAMVDQSPALARKIRKSGGNPVWNLAHMRSASFFRPISSEDGQSGPRPHFALCDEVHEHRNGLVIEMLERGFKFRLQPLLGMITNAGSDRNSVCYEEREHAVRVAAGTATPDDDFTFVGEAIDDTTFSFVCALDRGDDPLHDPSCWPKANPLLGVTITEDYLAGVVRQALAIPGKRNGILRLHFCVWTDSDTAWMSREALEACLADFEPEQEHAGAEICTGHDLSGTQDLTATAYVVQTGTTQVERTEEDGTVVTLTAPTFDAWIEAWTPRDTLRERALRDKAPYEVWVEQGHLNDPPGKVIRLDFVAARLARVATIFRIKAAAYDRYAFRKFEEECDALGLTIRFLEHPQGGKRRAKAPDDEVERAKREGKEAPLGLWMPGSVVELENAILEGRIRLRRSPVLISACMSAALEEDPFGNRWFSKRKATNRIDPVVALAMAVGTATRSAPADDKPGGILIL